ncbi:MAG: cyclase family protein [Candidatus Hodarchaeales archaeon]|jgi:arylformamidase
MKLIDISLELEKNVIIFPGDPQFTLTSVLDMSKGDEINSSEVHMGVHTGSHIDSPLHFIETGESITDIPLTRFYGKCQVLDLTFIEFGEEITKKHLEKDLLNSESIILFKTKNSSIISSNFREDYVSLSLEAAEHIIKSKIKTLGIDYLSIGSKNTHRILLSSGIVIYEGLTLTGVLPGKYTFSGFPLKILGSEGAPTRAVLIREKSYGI